MPDQLPTRRQMILSGLIPTLAALFAATIIVIDRLQIDWAVQHVRLFPQAWLPALVLFGFAHILGAGAFVSKDLNAVAWVGRCARALAFAAINFLRVGFGWLSFSSYFFAFSLLPPFLLMLAGVVSLDTSPPPDWARTAFVVHASEFLIFAGAALPGAIFGVLLGLLASPRRAHAPATDLWRPKKAYALGGGVSSVAFLWGLGLLDRDGDALFSADHAFVASMIALSVVTLACSALWLGSMASYWPLRRLIRDRGCQLIIGVLTLAPLPLAALSQAAVSAQASLIGDSFGPVARHIRDGLPLASRPILFHGARFVGPRDVIASRDALQNSFYIKGESVGLKGWGNLQITTYRQKDAAWPDCMTPAPGRTVCIDFVTARAHLAGGDNLVFYRQTDTAVPEAVLTQFDRVKIDGDVTVEKLFEALKTASRYGCHLELVGVPVEGLQARTGLYCGDRWSDTALQLTTQINAWFVKE